MVLLWRSQLACGWVKGSFAVMWSQNYRRAKCVIPENFTQLFRAPAHHWLSFALVWGPSSILWDMSISAEKQPQNTVCPNRRQVVCDLCSGRYWGRCGSFVIQDQEVLVKGCRFQQKVGNFSWNSCYVDFQPLLTTCFATHRDFK